MRFDIIVDHICRICVWRSREHRGVMHENLVISDCLRCRIDNWIAQHENLRRGSLDDEALHQAWLEYDAEGREIAGLIKPALGDEAEVYCYCEATEEWERIASL